ncbi:MAG: O-antigen ligase family protein [Chitinophagaceae bacterium]
MLKKEKFLYILCIIFFISFFLPVFVVLKVISMSALGAFCLIFPFIKPVTPIRPFREQLFFCVAFAVWILLSVLWSDDKSDASRYITLRLPLMLLPFTIGLVNISRNLRNRILLTFSYIVLFGTLISALYAFYHGYTEGNPAWLYNDYLSLLINQQSIYTSVLVNIAIYTLVWFLWNSRKRSEKTVYGFSIAILLVLSFLLASRNMMAILYLSIVAISIYLIVKKKKYILGGSVFAGVIALVAVVFTFFPKTLNRFRELKFTSYEFTREAPESHYAGNLDSGQWNGANFRLAAWSCGWELFKEHPVTGVGIGDKRNELIKVYEERNFKFAIRTKKNVHNNYLDILFSLGAIGFLLFFIGWLLLPIWKMARSKDLLAIWITGTFALAMITEVYFDRSLGGLLVGFFIPFLLVSRNDNQA